MQHLSRAHRSLPAATLVACLTTAACGAAAESPSPASRPPASAADPSAPLNTIAQRDVGDRLTATALVASVITVHAFVIADIDLPDQGLLVLGGPAGGVRPKSLVTVSGTVDRFDFDEFATAYGLEHRERYGRFAGRKVIVADQVRSWA